MPAYFWPPVSWVEAANRYRTFAVGYPAILPRGEYYARYWLPERGWLSVPIQRALRKNPPIATWEPASRWRLYHWRTIQTLYGKAPFFYEWRPFLEYLYLELSATTLREITTTILEYLASLYGWKFQWLPEKLPPYTPFPSPDTSILPILLRRGI
ncbi:MAG: WbqC family protein [Bacteroidia bacterium]|nr:WbqC family protein [Bacteroidia bacterium]